MGDVATRATLIVLQVFVALTAIFGAIVVPTSRSTGAERGAERPAVEAAAVV